MELAAQLQLLGIKLDRAMITKIELGLRPVSDIKIIAIADVLKISVQVLFNRSEVLFNQWIKKPE
jgi:transcriptional regulator with XRE-family HTH domain